MLVLILFVTALEVFAEAQEDEVIVPNNKTLCINQMVEWCNKMQYPQQGAGLALLSVTYEDPNGFYRVFCSSDADGTNCTRNRRPWFACSNDHVLTYKGENLTNATTDIDDDICTTADKAFNELFVQNLSYDNTSLKDEVQKSMEAFFEQMAMMEQQIDMIQQMLKNVPYLGDFWNVNDGGLPGEPRYQTSMPDFDNQTTTEKVNEIEKEWNILRGGKLNQIQNI